MLQLWPRPRMRKAGHRATNPWAGLYGSPDPPVPRPLPNATRRQEKREIRWRSGTQVPGLRRGRVVRRQGSGYLTSWYLISFSAYLLIAVSSCCPGAGLGRARWWWWDRDVWRSGRRRRSWLFGVGVQAAGGPVYGTRSCGGSGTSLGLCLRLGYLCVYHTESATVAVVGHRE